MVPVGDSPCGTVGLKAYKDEGAFAFEQTGGDVWVNKFGGKIHPLLNDVNNMMSALVHENGHKFQRHGEADSQLSVDEAEDAAYRIQIKHQSYAKTTKEFQKKTLLGYAIHLKALKKGKGDAKIESDVEEINNMLLKNAHYILSFIPGWGNGDFDIEVIIYE